jgi:hypothetical protein
MKYGFYRFISPPALKTMEIFSKADLKVWISGEEAELIQKTKEKCIYQSKKINAYSAEVIIRAKYIDGEYGGAVFAKPINLTCEKGKIEICDWSLIDSLRT